MSIKPLPSHYSMENVVSVYDEEAMTPIQLAGRTASKVNEVVKAFNDLDTQTGQTLATQNQAIQKMNDVTMPEKVKAEFRSNLDNGTFDTMIDVYAGQLTKRVDNILGSVSEGSTTLDAELIDMRLDNDGNVWENAGSSVRGQLKNVSKAIRSISKPVYTCIKCSDEYNMLDQNAYYNTSGEKVAHENYEVYEIPVSAGDVLALQVEYGFAVPDAVLMNDSGEFVRYYHTHSSGYKIGNINDTITIPVDGFLWVNNMKRHEAKIYLIEGYKPKSYETIDYVERVTKPLLTGGPITEALDGYTYQSHVLFANVLQEYTPTNNDYHVKEYGVEPGNVILVKGSTGYRNDFYQIYDDRDNVIASAGVEMPDQPYHEYSAVIIVPIGGYMIRVSGSNSIPASVGLVTGFDNGGNWSNLKWYCIGDSLTEKNDRATKNYHDYIAEKTGIQVTNAGSSGMGYMSENENGDYFELMSPSFTMFDVITIFGSGNDMKHIDKLGTPTDTNYNTICGRINSAIDTIRSDNPYAQLGIISPTPWQGNEPSDNGAFVRYCEALETICKNKGVPYLDLFHTSGMRPNDEYYREYFYSRDDGNGVHPDENGHKIIASRIYSFLESLISMF